MGIDRLLKLYELCVAICDSTEIDREKLTAYQAERLFGLAERCQCEARQILKELKAEGAEGGIEQSREEVTGIGTYSTNRNFSNTGFGGGSMVRLAAA